MGVLLGPFETNRKSKHKGHLLSFIKALKKHHWSIKNTTEKHVVGVGAFMCVKVEASVNEPLDSTVLQNIRRHWVSVKPNRWGDLDEVEEAHRLAVSGPVVVCGVRIMDCRVCVNCCGLYNHLDLQDPDQIWTANLYNLFQIMKTWLYSAKWTSRHWCSGSIHPHFLFGSIG